LAFTLSQLGMVFHWKRIGGAGARRSMAVNGLGALVYRRNGSGRRVHIDSGHTSGYLRHQWQGYVEEPAVKAGLAAPKLTVVASPYRFVISPIVDFVLDLERRNPGRQIAVLIPEMIERRWYFHPLHNQRAAALKTLLYFKGSHRIIVINLPWHVQAGWERVEGGH